MRHRAAERRFERRLLPDLLRKSGCVVGLKPKVARPRLCAATVLGGPSDIGKAGRPIRARCAPEVRHCRAAPQVPLLPRQ